MSHMSNPLATPDQLYQKRSFSALPTELQDAIFYSTQCLTQAAGILLQLAQSTTAQANVILARFWLVEPFMSHEFSDISAATIYLLSKVGPIPQPPRDICNVYAYLLSPSSSFFRPPTSPPPINDPTTYYLSDSAYQSFHNRILAAEARILYALSFNTHVALPHPLAVTYLQPLDFLGIDKHTISKRVMAYLNTSLLSPQMLYLTTQPNELAVAAIYNAAKDLGAKMPECDWWEVFDVDREVLGFLVVAMRGVEIWVRKMREDIPAMAEGMLTRRVVEKEMRKRGLHMGNGHDVVVDEGLDLEDQIARKMDERIAEMEAES